MKILVTEASGFVESALIDTLTQIPGHEVAGLVRRFSPTAIDSSWQRTVGDITDITSFKNGLRRITGGLLRDTQTCHNRLYALVGPLRQSVFR